MRLLSSVVLLTFLAAAQGPPLDWPALENEAVENLRAYVRLDTQNPPDNVAAAGAFLKQLLEKEGFEVRVFPSAPGTVNVLARLRSTAKAGTAAPKPLLLLNHMDVVPVDASRWKVPPFSAAVEDGQLWGRGAMDMKSLGMMELMAMAALKRSGHPLGRDILFLATADEETGGQWGAQWMIEHHYSELDPEYVIDEGGFGTRDVLAPGKRVYGISVADKRPVWVRLIATGSSGHGSQPIPDNANVLLVNALSRLLAYPQPPAALPLVETMQQKLGGRLADNKFTNAIQRNTISLTTLKAGVGDPPKPNVIPSRSEATLDCRLLPGQSPDEFLARLKREAGESVQVEPIYIAKDAAPSSTGTPFYAALERVLRKHAPGATIVPILVPYGTDGNLFRGRGATVYGFVPMVVDLSVVSSMHSDQEHIPLDEFKKGVRILYEVLAEFTAGR